MQGVREGNGVAISITGMLIVFCALTIVSLFIRLLPEVLAKLEPILPRLESHAHPPADAERLEIENERIVAAIGYVLHQEMQKASRGG